MSEARQELSGVLDQVERGEAFIIKGAGRGGALVINADTFRRFQEAYLELVGELETGRILQDDRAVRALQAATGEGGTSAKRYALSEVEEMVRESGGE